MSRLRPNAYRALFGQPTVARMVQQHTRCGLTMVPLRRAALQSSTVNLSQTGWWPRSPRVCCLLRTRLCRRAVPRWYSLLPLRQGESVAHPPCLDGYAISCLHRASVELCRSVTASASSPSCSPDTEARGPASRRPIATPLHSTRLPSRGGWPLQQPPGREPHPKRWVGRPA